MPNYCVVLMFTINPLLYSMVRMLAFSGWLTSLWFLILNYFLFLSQFLALFFKLVIFNSQQNYISD